MKRFNARITGWLAFCFIVGLGYMAGAQVRYTPEQEAKMNAAAKKAEEEARNLPAHEKKLESHLLKLVNKMTAENAKTQRDIPKKYGTRSTQIDAHGRIFVRIRCGSAADTLKIKNEIVRHGGEIYRVVISSVGFSPSVAAWVLYDRIKELARMTETGAILTIEPPRARTGDYLTAGDSQLKADEARSFFNVNGSGVKVAAISTGVEHFSVSQSSGDLPLTVNRPFGNGEVDDEGTAMLEIVHDLAPGASLFFAPPGNMPEDMAQRIVQLYGTYDCDIIVDDIGWFEAPYFLEDELMNTISGYTTTQNKIYISAAGNDGESSWSGMANVDENGWQLFYTGGGTSDINNYITLQPGQSVTIHLQWANPWHYAFDDYNLHLFDLVGNEVASATLEQDRLQDLPPKEKINFTNGQSSEIYSIRIKKMPGSEHRELKLLLAPTVYPLTYTAPSPSANKQQIYGHPASLKTISVGAYPAQNPSVLESFSSQGPTNIYNFFGGGGYTVDERETPTIVATDGVETKTGAEGHFDFPFFGTSAAAPHIAGIAALYVDEHPMDSNTDFINSLTLFAARLGTIGGGIWNPQSGFGKANAFATLKKEKVVQVEVYQLDAQEDPFGQVAVWEDNWVPYNVPATFVWPENSTQTLRAEQNFKPGTTTKYHDWNELNDVVNHHSFDIDQETTNLAAHFEPANNATLQANVIDLGGQAGAAEFKDPWLIDYLDPTYGMSRNQGMSAPFKTVNYTLNNLGTGTVYKGVFLNENPNFLPDRPVYFVRAPQTVDFGGAVGTRNIYLVNWSGTGASFQYPNASETAVVFNSDSAIVSSNLKGSMISTDASAFSNNSQRKFIETLSGGVTWLHQVYTSAGHVWIEHSSDGGNTWTLGNDRQPLDGSAGEKKSFHCLC